jgi:hypothetical protein
MSDFVKVSRKEWLRELYSCIKDNLSADDLAGKTENPAAQLLEKYIDWAATAYSGEEVPYANDLANYYVVGEFISKREVFKDDEDDPALACWGDWDTYCRARKCLFWDDEYACISDNYYEPPEENAPCRRKICVVVTEDGEFLVFSPEEFIRIASESEWVKVTFSTVTQNTFWIFWDPKESDFYSISNDRRGLSGEFGCHYFPKQDVYGLFDIEDYHKHGESLFADGPPKEQLPRRTTYANRN